MKIGVNIKPKENQKSNIYLAMLKNIFSIV